MRTPLIIFTLLCAAALAGYYAHRPANHNDHAQRLTPPTMVQHAMRSGYYCFPENHYDRKNGYGWWVEWTCD